ncbi:MAG TPA: nucleoside triphosphate pyrophosphohydrolase [Anaerolineaceae bacterium]|uniref:NTP pyrophosphohydrolase MazG-like domain-containing protein n=1 Tax=Anaerolinea thermophila TaxID=167964 RepID=A0A101FYX7_9CHLR|nr:MAG: hypothetical protein XD73_0168 [Anaerolinea thermophila]HAF62946.1 nucleoside triphosphate pyrophosphohydrolase [Anaerolineaceae bacterium]
MLDNSILQTALTLSDNSLTIIPWNLMKEKYSAPFSSNQNVLIIGFTQNDDLNRLQDLIKTVHSDQHTVVFLQAEDNMENNIKQSNIKLSELTEFKNNNNEAGFFIGASSEKYSLLDFQELVAHLRSPDGCPWDRKQTHQSLRPNLLEETYEVLSALDHENSAEMQEEFGDLLLQIVLHAQIASEAGTFNLEDVATGIQKKLIFRHPHIFSDTVVSGSEEVIRNWEVLKAQERKENHKEPRMLRSVPMSMPALSLAQAYQKRAARVGFDWETMEPVKQKIQEELQEVELAKDEEEQGKELGDVLFAVVNLIRWYGFDAESLLREASERFAQRFEYIEECVEKQGKTFAEYSLVELDAFWDEAKKGSKRSG